MWCCPRTLPSIVDEDIEAVFYALENDGDFMAHFSYTNVRSL